MDILSIIGVVFIAMILAWASASYFTDKGVKLGQKTNRHVHFVQSAQPVPSQPVHVDGFVRRVPGQEAGYIEDGVNG